jgi:hypothetical protein
MKFIHFSLSIIRMTECSLKDNAKKSDCLTFLNKTTIPITSKPLVTRLSNMVFNEYSTLQYGISILFRGKAPSTVFSFPMESLYPTYSTNYQKCIKCSCVSAMMILNTSVIKLDTDLIYATSVEINSGRFIFTLYETSFYQLQHDTLKLTNTFTKPIVYLDLDKTLYLSDMDCVEPSLFRSDFYIEGRLAFDNQSYFKNGIMIRPGASEFLERLQRIAHIFFITAADIVYAHEAIHKANQLNWMNTSSDTRVFIPLDTIYSVRYTISHFIPKSFSHILPITNINELSVPILAIDDDPTAWNILYKSHVIPILPFQPSNASPYDLLNIVDAMEKLKYYSKEDYVPNLCISISSGK